MSGKLKLNCIQSSDVQNVSIYQNTDIFIPYCDTTLAFGCIDTQFSKPGISHMSNFKPKRNYNKLACINLIDFKYNPTGHSFSFYIQLLFQISWYCIVSRYFGSDTWYYHLVISHIPNTKYNVYGEQDKCVANRSKCSVVGSMYMYPYM